MSKEIPSFPQTQFSSCLSYLKKQHYNSPSCFRQKSGIILGYCLLYRLTSNQVRQTPSSMGTKTPTTGDFPSSPMVKTQHFQCRGHGLFPAQGAETPHTIWRSQIKGKRSWPLSIPLPALSLLSLGWLVFLFPPSFSQVTLHSSWRDGCQPYVRWSYTFPKSPAMDSHCK